MANYRVGRVGIVPKGAYSASAAYEPLDLVEYSGASYVNKLACTGMDPTNTTYWQISAQQGATGPQGPKGDTGETGPQGPKGDTGSVPLPLQMAQVSGLSDALAAKLDKAGGTVTGAVAITNTTESTSETTGALVIAGGLGVSGDIYANVVYGGAWNDYAERRVVQEPDAYTGKCGQVVCETGGDKLALSTQRMQPCPYVITDTYGMEIGKRDKYALPVAVSGRVLVYVEGDRNDYQLGDVLCAAPGGLACKMTREEVREYPERILGVVCQVPQYEKWGEYVTVDGRVWIRV